MAVLLEAYPPDFTHDAVFFRHAVRNGLPISAGSAALSTERSQSTPHLAGPDTGVNDTTFGQITNFAQTNIPRNIQLSLRFHF
ncbi:hypothetical protein [Silvibacterium sp.]|uniref:hypothetical protein n=1 Tax=Silvibacterium sp. TaxID=1964179 RepID=UPI0039E255A7